MTWGLALLTALPIVAGSIYALRRLAQGGRRACYRAGLLASLALSLASPHLTNRAVGTGEAYNYSLAIADAITQLRADEIPVLAGQTEYAWNGRIHPLRNAPYLFYLAGSLDALTGRTLGFWALQNLTLVFSLGALVGLTYLALRRGAQCSSVCALALTAVYAFSPALLSTVFTQNLFMTVHVAAWLPIVFGSLARQADRPSVSADIVMGIGLAGAWLAHPPIAGWLTLLAVTLRLTILFKYHARRAFGGLAIATVSTVLLAGFVFVSVKTIGDDFALNADVAATRDNFEAAIHSTIDQAFPRAVLPVTREAGALGDLQFGYVAWGMLLLAAWQCRLPDRCRALRSAMVLTATFLLILCLPIPGLNRHLWSLLPYRLLLLTNVWPMQRLYLVALGAVVMAVGLAPPKLDRIGLRLRGTMSVFLIGWSVWQAWPFFARAWNQRWTMAATFASHQASNINLTVTSFAFLGTPPDFVAGPVDPSLQFRFADRHGNPLPSLRNQLVDRSAELQRGTVIRVEGPDGPTTQVQAGQFVLEPGKHYLLSSSFPSGAFRGFLQLRGTLMDRTYSLPAAGETLAFGIGQAHANTIGVATDQEQPETVTVAIILNSTAGDDLPAIGAPLMEFSWKVIDESQRPVAVQSWSPLRFTTTFKDQGCWVITPRRYLPDYQVTIDGVNYQPQCSPDGSLMIPLPIGERNVEVRYVGPPVLIASFWITLISWLVVGIAGIVWALGYRWTLPLASQFGQGRTAFVASIGLGWTILIVFAAYRTPIPKSPESGNLRFQLFLPLNHASKAEALLSVGSIGAGTVTYLEYVDDLHLRVGAELWGKRLESDLIPVDYFAAQTIRIEALGLTNATARDPDARLRIWVNDHLVLESQEPDFPSRPDQIVVGRNTLGSSLVSADFSGQIAVIDRIPRPPVDWWPLDRTLQIRVTPGNLAVSESRTLFEVGSRAAPGVVSLRRKKAATYALAWEAPDHTRREADLPSEEPGNGWLLDLKLQNREGSTHPGQLQLEVEHRGSPLWPETSPIPRRNPVDLRFNATDTSQGTILALVQPPAVDTRRDDDAVRISVRLPKTAFGQREPLLVTGKTGAGDAVYLIYEDAQTLRIGFDHWGIGGAVSDPIPIDYSSPHTFEIHLGSLRTFNLSSKANPSDLPRSGVMIEIDSVPVLHANFAPYPARPREIYFGRNGIAASTSGAEFTGRILAVERAPIDARTRKTQRW